MEKINSQCLYRTYGKNTIVNSYEGLIFAAAMNGVDAIAFTAGVGENNKVGRAEIAQYLGYLGTEIDEERNNVRGEDRIISKEGSKVAMLCVPTNEELAIARQTLELVK